MREGPDRFLGLLAPACSLALLLTPGCDSAEPGEPGEPGSAVAAADAGTAVPEDWDAYRFDPRLRPLLVPCVQKAYYDRDTSDMLPVLIEKLQKGYTEPLQRSKEELAGLGEDALVEVRRLADQYFNDAAGASYVQNALDVAILSDTETGRQMVLRFLEHPRETLRRGALRGLLLRHVRAEDFERLWVQLDVENAGLQQTIVPCMHRADPARAEEIFLGWIEARTYGHLWPLIAPILARSELLATAQAAAQLAPEAGDLVRPYLAACAARAGDEASLALLREDVVADEAPRRERAAHAASLAGLVDLLLHSSAADPNRGVRLAAISALAALDPTPALTARLQAALSDEDRAIRNVAMTALIARGDEGAIDLALSMLDSVPEDIQTALQALRPRFDIDRDLALRAFEWLRALDQARAHRPMAERIPLLKSIGVLPLRRAAAYLRQLGLEGGPGADEASRLRLHELLMIHASNTGAIGRAFLYEELELEQDPARRLDLLYACSAHRTDPARERLREFLSQEALSPYESVYAADMLARLGPAQTVAPLLKRVTYRTTQEDARIALRCLMWRWY